MGGEAKADIVERLLNPANVFYEYVADEGAMLREAADEIMRRGEALRLADAALRGSNMDMKAVEKKVLAALRGEK